MQVIKILATVVWNLSEKYKIPLGRLAPHLFGAMIGSKPVKIRDAKKKNT